MTLAMLSCEVDGDLDATAELDLYEDDLDPVMDDDSDEYQRVTSHRGPEPLDIPAFEDRFDGDLLMQLDVL